MSSLSQDVSKMEHHYQSSDTSDHGLLPHHQCTCCRECTEQSNPSKTDPAMVPPPSHHCHPHHLLNLNHHVHLNHPPLPKTNANTTAAACGSKGTGTSCSCHVKVLPITRPSNRDLKLRYRDKQGFAAAN